MRFRAWVGVGVAVGLGVVTLLVMPRASAPVDEAVRALGVMQMPDDPGWYIMRVNKMRTGTMHRTYVLPTGKTVTDKEVRERIAARLEPLGWLRPETGAEADSARWEKKGCNIAFARDTTNPAQHWIFVERPQGVLERWKDNLFP